MATLLENQLQAQYAPNREAELHNAQINERYRRLKEALTWRTSDDTRWLG